jgi:membrane-bound serine protease (ClpP class)
LPGIAGIIALLLFFGSSYILDLASILDIILFAAGIILLLLEIFVIPGFGVTGILGIICIIASLFLALIGGGNLPFWDTNQISIAIIQLASALAAALVLLIFLARFLPKSTIFNRLVLSHEENSDKGFVSSKPLSELIGKEGKALTTLRPAGMADFNGDKIDVVADGDYVQQGSRLKVLRVEGSKVVVREIKE